MTHCGNCYESDEINKPYIEDYNKTTESICRKIDKLTERVNKMIEMVEKINNTTFKVEDILKKI